MDTTTVIIYRKSTVVKASDFQQPQSQVIVLSLPFFTNWHYYSCVDFILTLLFRLRLTSDDMKRFNYITYISVFRSN